MIRKPAVSGYFYPGTGSALMSLLERLIPKDQVRKPASAVISPHAGLEYSGRVAGSVFASVQLPETFVLLGPSHRSFGGNPIAMMRQGSWETPLGEVSIDSGLAELIYESCRPLVSENAAAHQREHSLEVQLPFIQFFVSDPQIVPITIGHEVHLNDLEDLGRGVASAVGKNKGGVLIVASTDMSHYVDRATAERLDGLAIRHILDMDPSGLYDTVRRESISMCGFQPTVAALTAAAGLGATRAELVKYQTSGDVTGDDRQVVGYAGLRIF